MDPQQVRERIERIRARHDAATPGPWRWFGYIKGDGIGHARSKAARYCQQIYLSTVNRGRLIIMDFVKAGFRDAQPRFSNRQTDKDNPLLLPAAEFADHLRLYSGQFEGLTNPDATAIERSWEDVDFLLAELDRRAKQICALLRCHVRQEFEQGNHDDACPLDTGYIPTWLREEAPTP